MDFSAHSRTALRYARAIAKGSGGQLTVIYAADPWLENAAAAVYGGRTALAERTRTELLRFTARALGRDAGVETRLVSGDPVRTILATKTDLVVLGTHGLGGMSKVFFGSTTARVLERTRVPVLAVPSTHGRRLGPPRGWPAGRIVAPLALDRTSRGSAARAAAVARAFGTALTLVHAVPPLQVPPFMGAGILERNRAALAQARDKLAHLARQPRLFRGVSVRALVASGDPAEVIAAIASRPGHSLVVLTLDRRGGFLHSRPGTISYRVLQRGETPVLALPPGHR